MGSGDHAFTTEGFGGRNRVWFGGRSITGPSLRGIVLSFGTIALTAILAIVITFPWLLQNHKAFGIPVFVIFLLALLTSLQSGFLTGTTDPGIIPRSLTPPFDMLRTPGSPRERHIVLRGRTITVKYCETCQIWRPPHASHCSTCDNCVERFDHHCPYISGCVGRRNYRSFLTFISSTALLSATSIAAAILHLVFKVREFRRPEDVDLGEAFRTALGDQATAANFVVILVALFGSLFTTGLTGFHAYLMWNNVTTAESFKKANRNSACDEDDYRGLRAIIYLCTVPRPESRITADYNGPRYPDEEEIYSLIRKQIEEERQRNGSASGAAKHLGATSTRVPSALSRVIPLPTDVHQV